MFVSCLNKMIIQNMIVFLVSVIENVETTQLLFYFRGSTHPFERIATPFQVFSWTAPALDHTMDCVRAEDVISFRLGYEEHVPVQVNMLKVSAQASYTSSFSLIPLCWTKARDWNEELQATRELPRKNVTDRLMRDRAVFKVSLPLIICLT